MDEFPVVHIPTDEVLEEEEFERLYSASTEIIVLLSVFYIGISIVAVIGNTLVIWVVATTRQMRTVTNMYIANLAFADVVIGLFCIPFQFQAALLQRWNLPWFMCGFCPFIQTVSVNVSVFTLTAIAIDRHRAIINPLRARPTKFISKVIISGIWLFALTFAIPCAIAFRVELVHERFKENDVIFNVTRPFCLNQNLSEAQLATYRYALVFVQYLVPFCVISFVYIQMAVKLWGTRAPGNAQDSRDITLLKNKKKVIKMLIIVVIVFGLCWLPLQLYNILYVTIPEINEYHFISIVWFCCDWLAMSNSCYNPFIYGIYNEKFKREFNKRFAVCFCKFKTSLDTQERTVSMHTRASSIRSTYANSSMRIRNNIFGNGKPRINTINTHFVNNNSSYASTQNPMQNVVNFRQKLAKNNQPTSAYQGMNYDNCSSNGTFGFGTSITRNSDAPFELYQWRRNNFRPMQSDVIEQEADDDTMLTLIELHSTSPQPGGDEQNAAQQEEQTLSLPHSDSSCICQQELGSSTECDGTCILNEVSRVQVPSDKTVTPPTTTTTPTTEGVDAIEDAPVHAPLLWQSTNYYVQATEAAATPTTTTAVNNNSFKLDFNYSESTRDTEIMKHYAAAPTTDFNGTAGVAKSAMDVVAVVAANGGQCLTSQT